MEVGNWPAASAVLEKLARGALARFDGAVHVALPSLARVFTREDDASRAPREQWTPRRIEAGIEERIPAARPRVGGPVADVHSGHRRPVHSEPAQFREQRATAGGREVLSDLCWLGMNRAPVTAVHVGDWTSDPWARGGYAFADPGFDPAWRPLLSRRAGRMFFAGEHTSTRWQGYMNGAVETGQRAARELLADLR